MSPELQIAVVGAIATVAVAVVGGVVKIVLDLVREQRDRIDSVERDSQAKVAGLDDKISKMLRLDNLKDNYIADLRNHIWDHKPPPPPDWPSELIDHR